MCGILGVVTNSVVNLDTFQQRLSLLNHRGQEAVGILGLTTEGKRVAFYQDGVVMDVCRNSNDRFRMFRQNFDSLNPRAALGHLRYGTVGPRTAAEAQPILVPESPFGWFILVHNGQVVNHKQLRQQIDPTGKRVAIETDSAALAQLIAHAPVKSMTQALQWVIQKVPAAYSLLVLTADHLHAVRDRFGIRPLWFHSNSKRSLFASESASFLSHAGDALEVPAGTVVSCSLEDAQISCAGPSEMLFEPAHCICEVFYFARPDQRFGEMTGSELRRPLGAAVGRKMLSDDIKLDIITTVPQSGIGALMGVAQVYREAQLEPEGIIRNRYGYEGRSFLEPTTQKRARAAELKYSFNPHVFAGKSVGVIDDTIVRSTTAQVITRGLGKIGAAYVHWGIAAPPIKHPCVYGIDIPTDDELIANGSTPEQIAQAIGADSVTYLDLATTEKLCGLGKPGWCTACLTGNYPAAPDHCYSLELS